MVVIKKLLSLILLQVALLSGLQAAKGRRSKPTTTAPTRRSERTAGIPPEFNGGLPQGKTATKKRPAPDALVQDPSQNADLANKRARITVSDEDDETVIDDGGELMLSLIRDAATAASLSLDPMESSDSEESECEESEKSVDEDSDDEGVSNRTYHLRKRPQQSGWFKSLKMPFSHEKAKDELPEGDKAFNPYQLDSEGDDDGELSDEEIELFKEELLNAPFREPGGQQPQPATSPAPQPKVASTGRIWRIIKSIEIGLGISFWQAGHFFKGRALNLLAQGASQIASDEGYPVVNIENMIAFFGNLQFAATPAVILPILEYVVNCVVPEDRPRLRAFFTWVNRVYGVAVLAVVVKIISHNL